MGQGSQTHEPLCTMCILGAPVNDRATFFSVDTTAFAFGGGGVLDTFTLVFTSGLYFGYYFQPTTLVIIYYIILLYYILYIAPHSERRWRAREGEGGATRRMVVVTKKERRRAKAVGPKMILPGMFERRVNQPTYHVQIHVICGPVYPTFKHSG